MRNNVKDYLITFTVEAGSTATIRAFGKTDLIFHIRELLRDGVAEFTVKRETKMPK